MKRLWVALIAILGTISVILATFIMAGQAGENETINLGVTGSMGPLGLIYSNGVERGIYEKYGLNVTCNRVNDVYTSMLALLTGKFDSISTSPGIFTSAYLDGENISVGMVLSYSSNLMLIVKPGYTDLQSLRGKRLGVIGTNSDSYRITKSYLQGRGLDIETDLELVEIKKPSSLLSVFQTDQLEAAVLMSGYAAEAISSGGIVVTTIKDAAEEVYGHPAYSTMIIFGEHFLERKRAVDKFLRAQREIAREIEKDPEGAIAIHAAYAEQDPEKMRAVFEMIDLVCDLDPDTQENLIAYSQYGATQGFFDRAMGEEVFYDDWR